MLGDVHGNLANAIRVALEQAFERGYELGHTHGTDQTEAHYMRYQVQRSEARDSTERLLNQIHRDALAVEHPGGGNG